MFRLETRLVNVDCKSLIREILKDSTVVKERK